MDTRRYVKIGRSLLAVGFVTTAVGCSSATETTPDPVAPPSTVPATQGDVARLEKENAELREQVKKLGGGDPAVRAAVADAKLEKHEIKHNKLEPGMTLEECSAVITGRATVYSENTKLVSETSDEVTYEIASNSQIGGPGSGGAAGVGVNMRGDRPTPKMNWVCVFDKSTGLLKSFSRD